MQKKRGETANTFYFPDTPPHNKSEYKCIFCSEGSGIRNIIDQIDQVAETSGISKHDIIQLALIEEIRKIRIALENKPITILDRQEERDEHID